jgi:flagellar biosynthesis protein FliR
MILEQALNSAELAIAQAEMFFLVLIRVSFIIFLMPFLSSDLVLLRIKVGLSFFISLAVFPLLQESVLTIHPGTVHIFILVLKECLIGILIGFVGQFLFSFVEFGASIMNRDIGLSQTPIIDPSTGTETYELSQLLVNIFSVIFLIAGLHRYFFEILMDSFEHIPLGSMQFHEDKISWIAISLVSESILYGFRFAAPVFATILVSLLGMAFVSRIMPQLNIWIVSVPIKIGLGIITLYYSLPLMYTIFESVFGRLQSYGRLLIRIGAGHG